MRTDGRTKYNLNIEHLCNWKCSNRYCLLKETSDSNLKRSTYTSRRKFITDRQIQNDIVKVYLCSNKAAKPRGSSSYGERLRWIIGWKQIDYYLLVVNLHYNSLWRSCDRNATSEMLFWLLSKIDCIFVKKSHTTNIQCTSYLVRQSVG